MDGWRRGCLGICYVYSPHRLEHTHTHVPIYPCVPGRKWWAPLAIFVLSICYHSPPSVVPPRAIPPSVAALFFRATYIYVCVCMCVCTSLSVRCVYVYARARVCMCVTARPCIYAFVRRYLLRIGFSPLSTILCLYPVPCAPVSRIFAKKEYTLPLSLAEVDTHAHARGSCHRRLYLYVQSQWPNGGRGAGRRRKGNGQRKGLYAEVAFWFRRHSPSRMDCICKNQRLIRCWWQKSGRTVITFTSSCVAIDR